VIRLSIVHGTVSSVAVITLLLFGWAGKEEGR